jgi:hypothetical protein
MAPALGTHFLGESHAAPVADAAQRQALAKPTAGTIVPMVEKNWERSLLKEHRDGGLGGTW